MDTGTWYYATGEAQHGPYTSEQIRALLRDGVVGRDTYVWSPALAEWTVLARTELAALIAAPSPRPPMAPPRSSEPQPRPTPQTLEPQTRNTTPHTPAGAMGGPLAPVAAGRPGGGFDLGALEQGEGFPAVLLRAARTCIQAKYVDFRGRAGRPEFWWYQLFAVVVLVVAQIVDVILAKITGIGVLYLLVALALFLPSLGASVRRLHDTNRSGWWVLISLVPLVGAIVLIVFLCLPGDQGDNRFGPPPQPV